MNCPNVPVFGFVLLFLFVARNIITMRLFEPIDFGHFNHIVI